MMYVRPCEAPTGVTGATRKRGSEVLHHAEYQSRTREREIH